MDLPDSAPPVGRRDGHDRPLCDRLVSPDEPCVALAANRVTVGRTTYRLCSQHSQEAHDRGYATKEGVGNVL